MEAIEFKSRIKEKYCNINKIIKKSIQYRKKYRSKDLIKSSLETISFDLGGKFLFYMNDTWQDLHFSFSLLIKGCLGPTFENFSQFMNTRNVENW
jgi:hypothetical protein